MQPKRILLYSTLFLLSYCVTQAQSPINNNKNLLIEFNKESSDNCKNMLQLIDNDTINNIYCYNDNETVANFICNDTLCGVLIKYLNSYRYMMISRVGKRQWKYVYGAPLGLSSMSIIVNDTIIKERYYIQKNIFYYLLSPQIVFIKNLLGDKKEPFDRFIEFKHGYNVELYDKVGAGSLKIAGTKWSDPSIITKPINK